MKGRQIYALYRGDENLADGTAEELARFLGVKVNTVLHMSTPAHHRKDKGQQLVVVKLEKEKLG
ncbi:hypothetical protein [Lonepinella sp. BR2474]|uniref:hypothetical protein n=1 Tax=unclassified Lonepinella TaxID=2642006 RepID=UPI003F6E1BDB